MMVTVRTMALMMMVTLVMIILEKLSRKGYAQAMTVYAFQADLFSALFCCYNMYSRLLMSKTGVDTKVGQQSLYSGNSTSPQNFTGSPTAKQTVFVKV